MWPLAAAYGMPPGYGYGEVQARSRRRERDDSSDSRDKHRKRKREGEEPKKDKGKKEKKEKRDRDPKGDDAYARADERSRRKDSGDAPTPTDARRPRPGSAPDPLGIVSASPGPQPAQPQKSRSPPGSKNSKKGWREEVAQDGDEDERDLSTDDEARDKKLIEARRRREEMKAKWEKKQSEDTAAEAAAAGAEASVQAAAAREDEEAGKNAGDGAAPPSAEAGGAATGGSKADTAGTEGVEGGKASATGGARPAIEATPAQRAREQQVSNFILESRRRQEHMGGDMFDESEQAGNELKKSMRQSAAIGLTGASGDDWDDEEGYYIAKIGEVMGGRYLIVEAFCGRGVFSGVVKAKDQQDAEQGLVAIKVMRANDMMTKAAEKEVEILERLNSSDKNDKRHIIRLLTTFYYRKHFCLVFECMWDDLRAALKKYTKNKGMSMQAVRAYTQQLLIGLAHMHKNQIIHADIKPDNILISKGHHIVKFCDLGTAVEMKDVGCSPYLASRFYRPPEVILGCEYTQAVDTWALGCTLYELFTGRTLLTSKTNNDHLRKIMELRGKIPIKVIKKGVVWKNHFTEDLDFKHEGEDEGTKQKVVRTITDLNAKRSIKDLILDRVGPEKRQSTAAEDQQYVKKSTQFADLLEQMLALDPDKRIRPEDALQHPFLQDGAFGKAGAGTGGHGK